MNGMALTTKAMVQVITVILTMVALNITMDMDMDMAMVTTDINHTMVIIKYSATSLARRKFSKSAPCRRNAIKFATKLTDK